MDGSNDCFLVGSAVNFLKYFSLEVSQVFLFLR